MQVIDPTSPVRKHFQLREILLDMLGATSPSMTRSPASVSSAPASAWPA
jgi:hypothetical protein